MEGKRAADGSARVNRDGQLALAVGAVIKQRPRRQLPVVQGGGNPEVCGGSQAGGQAGVGGTDGERGSLLLPNTVTKESGEWALPKLLLCGPGERETVVKQAVAFRQADSRPPLWHVFWMTLMECGWKERLTLIWTMLRELRRSESKSWVWLFIQNKELYFFKNSHASQIPLPT